MYNIIYKIRHLLGDIVDYGNIPYTLMPQRKIYKKLNNLNENILNKKVIFVISTGRAGSEFLAKILGKCEAVISKHEPFPRINGKYLTCSEKKRIYGSLMKFCVVYTILEKNKNIDVYAETSHMFIKTFYREICSRFTNITVINLQRDPERILKSCIDLGYFSNQNYSWNRWMYVPNWIENETADSVEKCLGYIYDITLKKQIFENEFPQVKIINFKTENLSDPLKVKGLLGNLELNFEENLDSIVKEKVNSRNRRKTMIKNSVTLEECKTRLLEFQDKYQSVLSGLHSDTIS